MHAHFDTAVTVWKAHFGLDLTGKECSGVLYILPEGLKEDGVLQGVCMDMCVCLRSNR